MNIYFDESGSFVKENKTDDTFVCALIIPNLYEDEIATEFLNFKKSITSERNEIKGSGLDITSRINFCEWILNLKGKIKIKCNCILAEHNDHSKLAPHRKKTADETLRVIQYYAEKFGADSEICGYLKRYEGLIRHNTRLPDLDFYHFGLYNDAIRDAIQFSIVYFLEEKHKKNFFEYRFIFDRKLTTKLAPVEKLIKDYLIYLWDNRARTGNSDPIGLPEFWRGTDHPFIQSFFDESQHLSLNKIFRNGFEFVDSRENIGVQIVDILVNTIYKHFKDPNDRSIQYCYKTILPLLGTTNGHEILCIQLFK